MEEQIGGLPTFDLETIHWDIPIAVGFFDGANYHEFIKENETDDVIWRFLTYLRESFRGMKVYAHYASKFDNKFILSSLLQHNEIVKMEAGLMRLRWKDPNISFEDSYPMVPMSLEKINKMFGVEDKQIWDHRKTLAPWEMGDRLTSFRDYMKNDCISLSHSLYKLCELLGTTFGQMPSISLATTSAKVFDKCFHSVDDIEPNEEYERFIREAIYGGRNEVYERYGENINIYDVHWMYTSCYDVPIPVGKMRWVKPNLDKGTITEAYVKVPKDWYIGPLPYRQRGILGFPVGEFLGWWDTRELKNSMEMGVDAILKRQLYCEEEPILANFGQFMETLRDTDKRQFWKMFGISVSGKFGQGRWRDEVKHISEIKYIEGYVPLDDKEEYFVCKEYQGSRAPYIRPLVSMRIRSEARIRHLKLLTEASKKGRIFYGDTDSIFTTAELPTGKDVGDLVLVGRAERGYFIRQKLYAIIQGGRLTQRSSGYSDLKLTEEDFSSLLQGRNIDMDVSFLPSYRKTLSSKEFKLLESSRHIKGVLGESRVSSGITTRPICLQSQLENP